MHKFHPIADCFPLIDGDEFNDLVTDIKTNGLLEKIVLYEGMILDGRNRERACELAGVTPAYEQYKGDKPIKFAISKNSIRRHMTTSQRALAASELETLEHGGNRQDANLHLAPIRSEIAADMKVSTRSVATAKTIKDPDLKAAVKTGKKSVNAGAKEQKARVASGTTKKGSAGKSGPSVDDMRKTKSARSRKVFWKTFLDSFAQALTNTLTAIDRFETDPDPDDRPEYDNWYRIATQLSQEAERLHGLYTGKMTK